MNSKGEYSAEHLVTRLSLFLAIFTSQCQFDFYNELIILYMFRAHHKIPSYGVSEVNFFAYKICIYYKGLEILQENMNIYLRQCSE